MKSSPLIYAILFSIAMGCQPSTKSPSEVVSEETISQDRTQVTLTDQQKEEGWTPLFDGNTLQGWRTFKGKEQDSWEVMADGILHCKSFDDAQRRADLITDGQHKDFELSFEWKISPQGNSGVMFRVTEEFDQPYFTGPEYQLLDDEGYPGDVKDVHYSGGNYDMHEPNVQAAKPVGEWNLSILNVKGNKVEHWLNGINVVSYEIGSDEWTQRRTASKWNDVEGYANRSTGHIALQDHKHEAWFRNILIRSL